MPHQSSPQAEELLDQEIKVLDKGFIRLVDFMGSDQRIVDAARVSYQAGTKTLRTDEQLIRYLLRHKHTTPLEKVRFEFHVKLPIFVARQWMRHRMGSFNEMSARYSVLPDEFYYPETLRAQSGSNKQGSEGTISAKNERIGQEYLKEHTDRAYGLYTDMLDNGIARELARMVLPVNIYTQFYWTVDLWNLLHFMKLRSDPHAQWEIQEYSRVLEACVKAVAPFTYQAFVDYVRDAINFSGPEKNAIVAMLDRALFSFSNEPDLVVEKYAKSAGMTTRTPSDKLTREFKELLVKLGLGT